MVQWLIAHTAFKRIQVCFPASVSSTAQLSVTASVDSSTHVHMPTHKHTYIHIIKNKEILKKNALENDG